MENDLVNLLKKHNIALSYEQIVKLEQLKKETLLANSLFNLTSVEEKDFDVKMILDCLVFINNLPKGNLKLIDVGSGAGFPGLVLAICLPDYSVTCLEATRKKCNHIANIVNKLHLSNVEVVNERVESFVKTHRNMYDIAIARALKSLNILVELLTPLVKVNGLVIAMKSLNYSEELKQANNGIKKLFLNLISCEHFILNDTDTRIVLFFKKEKQTPNKYPRTYSEIISKPL